MRNRLARDDEPLRALGALASAFATFTARIIIPDEIAEPDRIQRNQTDRKIDREFLSLAVKSPTWPRPTTAAP
jgi:hypothetical protein